MVYDLHDETLIKKLHNKTEAQAFFNKTLEECKKMSKTHAKEHLVKTLKILRRAQGSWVLDNKIGNFFYKLVASIILTLNKRRHD